MHFLIHIQLAPDELEMVDKTFTTCTNECITKASEDFDSLKTKVVECANEMSGNGTTTEVSLVTDDNDNDIEDVSTTDAADISTTDQTTNASNSTNTTETPATTNETPATLVSNTNSTSDNAR